MHANTATHASNDLDLIACMHTDMHASIRAGTVAGGFSHSAASFHVSQAYVPMSEGAGCTHARVHMSRHRFTPQAARTLVNGRQAAANAEHAKHARIDSRSHIDDHIGSRTH